MASTTKIATTIATTILLISLFSIQIPAAVAQKLPVSAPQPSMAMSPASPSTGLDCMTVLLNMSDCLTFVAPGSKTTKPDKACCPELAGLLDSNPICLCQLLGDPGKIGIQIDINKALKLPSVCSLDAPPVSTCSALGIPVAAPTSSDEAPAPSPGLGGSALSPASDNKNDAAPTMAFSKMHIILGLGIMFFFTLF